MTTTDTETIRRYVEHGIKQGWQNPQKNLKFVKFERHLYLGKFGTIHLAYKDPQGEGISIEVPIYSINDILFDQSLTKIVWGEEDCYPGTYDVREDGDFDSTIMKEWEYQLQQLAIAKDRIGYLAQELDRLEQLHHQTTNNE